MPELDLSDLAPGWDADDLPEVATGCNTDTAAYVPFARLGVDLEIEHPDDTRRPEYGPAAMYAIYPVVDRAIPSMEVSGIVGDARHLSGYHRARQALINAGKRGDYSIQAPADKDGERWACAGIDLKFSTRDMKIVTARLMRACQQNDPRIECVREFYGTLDGRRVTGWNRYRTGRPVGYVTAGPSHLWHVHVSVFRRYVNDRDLMRGLADVIIGKPLDKPPEKPAETALWIAQFNVQRDDWRKAGDEPWQTSLPKLVQLLKASGSSVLILNECDYQAAGQIAAGLGPQWTWERVGDGVANNNAVNCVMYDKTKYRRTRLIYEVLPGNGTRTLIAPTLERDGIEFTVGSLHLDSSSDGYRDDESPAVRRAQMAAVLNRLPKTRCVFGGDLNDATEGGVRAQARAAGFRTLDDLVTVGDGQLGTTNDRRHIDECFVTSDMEVTEAAIVDAGTASDHNLTRFRLVLNPQAPQDNTEEEEIMAVKDEVIEGVANSAVVQLGGAQPGTKWSLGHLADHTRRSLAEANSTLATLATQVAELTAKVDALAAALQPKEPEA